MPQAIGANTSLILLQGDGADGSTTITNDSPSGIAFSAQGDARIRTAQSKFGGSSLYFDGNGDYLLSPGTDNRLSPFQFGNFTFRAWVYRLSDSINFGGLIASNDSNYNSTASSISIFGSSTGLPAAQRNKLVVSNGGFPSLFSAVYSESTIPLAQWTHVEIGKDGQWFLVFVNGVLERVANAFVSGFSFSGQLPGQEGTRIGSIRWDGANGFFDGYIDSVQYIQGVCLHHENFAVPTAPHSATFDVDPKTRALDPVKYGNSPAAPSSKALGSPIFVNDRVDGGRGYIVGTVKEKATPTNLPLRRKVRLFREHDGRFIRETWSDAVTGNYAFNNIEAGIRYTVVSYDYEQDYRAVIADNLLPRGRMIVRISQQHNEDRLEGTLAQLMRGSGFVKLRVYDNPMPATTSDPPTTPLVAEFTFVEPPGTVSANKLTLAIPPNTPVLVNDDIRWARFINGEGNASMDVDVSDLAGNGAIKFEDVDGLVAGEMLRILSAEIG